MVAWRKLPLFPAALSEFKRLNHVSKGIPGTQVADRRYSTAQRMTAEEVDSSRSPGDHQTPKGAENGHPAELHPTAQVDQSGPFHLAFSQT
jgi:hypothetical protein